MRAITEDALRLELRNTQPDTYYIPTGKILTPAAREYLQQRKIKIAREGECPQPRIVDTPVPPADPPAVPRMEMSAPKPKYVDYQTGAFYMEKPEHMCQLFDNQLVPKNHPRILFRGKLDSLQALVVLNQALIAEGGNRLLLADLNDVLKSLRNIMRCDVLDEELHNETIIGLTHAELRAHSHDPMKFYNIKQMILPDYTMGRNYALLNQLRTAIRETEVAAAQAFYDGFKYSRGDIIEELNRLSSALHIMMCKYLAGLYQEKEAAK